LQASFNHILFQIPHIYNIRVKLEYLNDLIESLLKPSPTVYKFWPSTSTATLTIM